MDRTSTLRDYLSVLRRRWLLLCGTVAVCLVVALAVSYTTTPLYRATVQLTYAKQPSIAAALAGTADYASSLDVKQEIETHSDLMTSEEMRQRAQQQAPGVPLGPKSVTITAEYVTDTNLMSLSAESRDPRLAVTIADAYSRAFIEYLRLKTLQQYTAAEDIIKDKIKGIPSGRRAAGDPAFLALLGRLEDIRILKAAVTGNFEIAAKAQAPEGPFTPNHTRDAVLGLLIGLVAGIGLVALAEQLDVRAHTVDEVGDFLELPVIGRLPRPSARGAGRSGLLAVNDPEGPGAEAFRMMRSNLDFVAVDEEVKSVLFTSCTQSEGKTTTVCNLAVTLARGGRDVVVVDVDLRRPHVHTFFGAPNTIGVSSVVSGQSTVEDSLQKIVVTPPESSSHHGGRLGTVRLLTSGPLPPNPGEIVASRRLGSVIQELAASADIVLVDAAPVLVVGDTAALARSVSGVIVVTRLGKITKSMMKELRESLAALPCRTLGIVVTNIPAESARYRYKYYRHRSHVEDAAPAADAEAAGAPAEQA